MRQIDSSMACDGPGGGYEVWAHHMLDDGMVEAIDLRLSKAEVVEQVLDSSEPDPWPVWGLLESVPGQEERLRRLGALSTMSVIRRCGNNAHRDGARTTTQGAMRLEAVARVLWVPKDSRMTEVPIDELRPNDDETMYAQVVEGNASTRFATVVSVPLTSAERARARRRSLVRIMPLISSLPVYPQLH